VLIPSPELILTGMLIGVIASAPVGPVNVLCIQRTISHGFFAGLASGTGAVLADGVFAFLAAWGITAISDLMLQKRAILQTVGGAVLIVFGIKLFLTKAAISKSDLASAAGEQDGFWAYVWSIPETFFLTITNPAAMLGMFALVGGGGSALGGLSTPEALTFVISVMGGSMLWWFLIARGIASFRHKLNEQRLRLINQAAAIVLIGFGVAVLGQQVARTLGMAT
jgi:threonine/homoserine/homoserine lactone efflux protein